MIEVDFGAGAVEVPAGMVYLDLTGRGAIPVPPAGPIRWSELDKFPACRTIEWSGADRGVIGEVAARSFGFLYWHDAIGDIDLTATRATDFRFDGVHLQRIRLPKTAEVLLLREIPETLAVDAHEDGRGLDLRLCPGGRPPVIPAGVRAAATVWVAAGGTMSLTALSGMTGLERLRVSFDDPPGRLRDLDALEVHRGLTELQLDSAYDWDPESLPALASLRRLELNGTSTPTKAAVRARYKGGLVAVEVTGAKSPQWLQRHLANPFRDWVDDGEAFGRAACEAYNRAEERLEREPQAALRGLIADLNAIEAEHGLIDTINREHAGEVFFELALRAGVTDADAQRWFAERDW